MKNRYNIFWKLNLMDSFYGHLFQTGGSRSPQQRGFSKWQTFTKEMLSFSNLKWVGEEWRQTLLKWLIFAIGQRYDHQIYCYCIFDILGCAWNFFKDWKLDKKNCVKSMGGGGIKSRQIHQCLRGKVWYLKKLHLSKNIASTD